MLVDVEERVLPKKNFFNIIVMSTGTLYILRAWFNIWWGIDPYVLARSNHIMC